MFGLFKKKTEKEKLQDRYKKLMEASYKLSRTDRAAADAKAAEAEDVLKQIESIDD